MATLDVNGDGFADVLVGSSSAASGAGRAHLYLGGPAGVSTSPIVLAGGGDARGFGYSVASAGDIDGDGYADIIIGAYISASDAGRAYLYRGSGDGPSVPPIELDAPDGGYFGSPLQVRAT